MTNNWSSPMQRIRAYARSVSESASEGDFEAAFIALDIIDKLLDEVRGAMEVEMARRKGLEVSARD